MISLEQLSKEFNYRHDFIYDDLNYLSSKYNPIKFNNIPEAWIPEIDRILSSINDRSFISSISQVMGFICISKNKKENKKSSKLLKDLDRNIKSIDIDLHEDLCEGIILN